MSKTNEFRRIFEQSLSDIASATSSRPKEEEEEEQERCIILSGGVDTCAILAASKRIGVKYNAAFTVITGNDSPDKGFAEAAAKEYDIKHHVIEMTPSEMVSTYLPVCVKLLHTFDGMTLRNSLVVAAAFKKAAEEGFKHAIVGDGADELFGGYSFMCGCADDPDQWKERRDDMCRKWTFATETLAKHYGLESHSPYMIPRMVEWALNNTNREDCIGERPIRLVYDGEALDHQVGKILLREAYETVSSWRRKDPIEVGSGITVIGHDLYWNKTITDKAFQEERAELLKRGFNIKTKESLVNFRVFEKCFGRNGAEFPVKSRLAIGDGCAGCCFEIGDKNFCDICGTYPAQR